MKYSFVPTWLEFVQLNTNFASGAVLTPTRLAGKMHSSADGTRVFLLAAQTQGHSAPCSATRVARLQVPEVRWSHCLQGRPRIFKFALRKAAPSTKSDIKAGAGLLPSRLELSGHRQLDVRAPVGAVSGAQDSCSRATSVKCKE